MKWDVIIVGAGPAGSFTAEKLATSGFKVLLLEEHKEIGKPVQCAGLISPRTMKLSGAAENTIINKLTGLRVFSPLGSHLHINSRQVHALAIDRATFDLNLASNAEKSGAILLTGARAVGLERISGGYQVSVTWNDKEIKCRTRLVIGADGVFSKVARWLNLKNDNPRAVMYAADVELPVANTDIIDVFLGRLLAPGWFGWVIPLDNKTCRVGSGIALIKQNRSPEYYFQQIVNKYTDYFKGLKIIKHTGGVVPIGAMAKIYASHAMLVGDAASQIKPISGGGIYMGLRGAQICSQVAINSLIENDLSERNLYNYQCLWEREMGAEIDCGVSYREHFLNFSDKDIELVIRLLSSPKRQNLIIKYGDIDYPSGLARFLFNVGPLKKWFIKGAVGMVSYGSLFIPDL